MKKYFFSAIIDDVILFVSACFVFFSPFLIWVSTKNIYDWYVLVWVGLAYINLIYSYIKFDSKEWKTAYDLRTRIESLTPDQQREMLKRLDQ